PWGCDAQAPGPRAAPQPSVVDGRFGDGFDALERCAHALLELAVARQNQVGESDVPGCPFELVGLCRRGASVGWLEHIAPAGLFASVLVDRGERKLATTFGRDHSPFGRPAHRSDPVVSLELGADDRTVALDPLASVTLGTPLADAAQVA